MTDGWQTNRPSPTDDADEKSISLDHQGIPILNEIVDPDAIQSGFEENSLQQDLLFDEQTTAEHADSNGPDLAQIRAELIEEIRIEMLAVIEQTSNAIANQMRDELAATLKRTLISAMDEKLQALPDTLTEVSSDQLDH